VRAEDRKTTPAVAVLRREKVEPAPIPPRKREREPSPVFSLEDEEEGGGGEGEGGRISPLPPPPPDLRIPKLRKTEQREEQRQPRKRSGEPLTAPAAGGAESKRPKPIQIE
jgi:hypothetical protein